MTNTVRHSVPEDILALLLGPALCALGVQFLTHAGLVTGQTVGLGVLLSYLTKYSFGTVFFVINLPFYALAFLGMGSGFFFKTFVCIGVTSVMTEIIPMFFQIADLHPIFAAVCGGALTGVGLLVLFRHGASLGGIGILALYLQKRTGFNAGWTKLGFDVVLFAVVVFILPVDVVIYSLLGAIASNLIIGVNHRTDRYVAG